MEFGLRALMNEMFGPAPPFPREYMEKIPTASTMRKKTYRRQPLRRAAVARDLNLNEQQPIKKIPATPQPQAGVKERGYVTSLPSGTRRAPNAMTQTQLPGGEGTVSGMTADQFRDSMRRTEQGLPTPSPFGKAMGKLSKTLERIRGGIERRLPSELNKQRFGRPDMDTNPYGYMDPTKANPIDRDRYIRSTGDRNEEGYLATVYGPHPT